MVVGENGILNRATDASEKTKLASEKEAIEFIMTEMKMDSYIEEDSKISIGRKLYDRNVENGDKWDVVVEKETGVTYGTGCTFIPKGTVLNDGTKMASNWIIDENGNLKELADNGFTELDFSSTVGITEGLIFNMDPNNLGEEIDNWGDNVTLRYYNAQEYNTIETRKSALEVQKNTYVSVEENDAGYDREKAEDASEYIDNENNAFKFNGNNYIEIYNKDGFDFSKGITFEFYGKLSKDISCAIADANLISLFGIWDGNFVNLPDTRFGINLYNKAIVYSLFTGYRNEESAGKFSESSNNPFNQSINYESNGINLDDDLYVSISVKPSETNEKATQIICANNKIIGEGWLSGKYYDYFLNNIKNRKYMDLGRCGWTYGGNWCYMNGSCYALRMYNIALNKEEILTNYNKTIAYRELMKNGN